MSEELNRRIVTLNLRLQNVGLALSDLAREINEFISVCMNEMEKLKQGKTEKQS